MIEFVKMHCNGNSFIITNDEKITKCSFEKLNQNKDLKFDQLLIYKEDDDKDYFIICKKQTCSPKLKNLEEVDKYLSDF